MTLSILTPQQKQAYEDDGYLHLRGFYAGAELERLRGEYHKLVTETEGRPKNMSYAYMEPPRATHPTTSTRRTWRA